jgi:penicillin-binding protein 1A
MWILLVVAALLALGGVVAAVSIHVTLLRDLPDFRSLADYRPALTTVVLDRRGRPIGEFFEQRRRLVAIDALPDHVVLAFLAAEDDSFFEHSGLDYVAILRAAWVDLTITMQMAKNLLLTPERRFRRKLKEMILARRIEERFTKDEILFLYLNEIYFGAGAYGVSEAARTYFRKEVWDLTTSEAALLAGLPKAPSKNSPFVNPEAAEARRLYVLQRMRDSRFIDDAAFEAALAEPPAIASPEPHSDFEVARYFTEEVRRALFAALGGDTVLRGGLVVHTTLDVDLQRTAVAALRKGLEALERRRGYRGPLRRVAAPEIGNEIERLGAENELLAAPGGEPPPLPTDRLLVGIVTEVDATRESARVAFAPGTRATVRLEDVDWAREPNPSRYPTPVKSIEKVFRVGDVAHFVRLAPEADPNSQEPELRVVLHQEPIVEGALLSFEVDRGDVLALVGGYDFERSEFNRAVQARRQPGSAFKPLIYAAALDEGFTATSILHDRPVVYSDPESGFTWRPENYGRRFLGPLTLREALARSVNNATIHLLREVGVGDAIDYARRLGIESPLERNLSLALGASSISLFELTRAFATFPAGGRRVVPYFIRQVLNPEGEVLLETVPLAATQQLPGPNGEPRLENAPREPQEPEQTEDPDRLIDAAQAYLATDLLRAVIADPKGTGRRARVLGPGLAGKTGTTNEQGDAWFVGFSPDVATGVWVGFDEKSVLGKGETGSRAALPIWIDFMQAALVERPARDFPMPEGIVVVRVDRETGLLADANSEDAYFQAFREGTEPTEAASTALSSAEGRRRLLEF